MAMIQISNLSPAVETESFLVELQATDSDNILGGSHKGSGGYGGKGSKGSKGGTGARKIDAAAVDPQKGSGSAPRPAAREPEEKSPERDSHAEPAARDIPPAPKFMLDEEDF